MIFVMEAESEGKGRVANLLGWMLMTHLNIHTETLSKHWGTFLAQAFKETPAQSLVDHQANQVASQVS